VSAGAALRDRLRGGPPAIGLWLSIPTPLTAEAAAGAGPDYVVVDQQHGAVEPSSLMAMLQAIAAAGTPALVRVGRNDPWIIGHALDLGAAGVIVPMVESADEAAAAVAACRYAPEGVRSWGAVRGDVGDEPVCLVMIETRRGLDAAGAIAATPGLDGVYIGPSDLALSLGRRPTLRLEHPPVLEGITRVREACDEAGVLCGLHCLAADDVAARRGDGFAMLTAGGDALHLEAALRAAVDEARGG
jgi:4-hydroxy-2-oxoheptanedioate aldolase